MLIGTIHVSYRELSSQIHKPTWTSLAVELQVPTFQKQERSHRSRELKKKSHSYGGLFLVLTVSNTSEVVFATLHHLMLFKVSELWGRCICINEIHIFIYFLTLLCILPLRSTDVPTRGSGLCWWAFGQPAETAYELWIVIMLGLERVKSEKAGYGDTLSQWVFNSDVKWDQNFCCMPCFNTHHIGLIGSYFSALHEFYVLMNYLRLCKFWGRERSSSSFVTHWWVISKNMPFTGTQCWVLTLLLRSEGKYNQWKNCQSWQSIMFWFRRFFMCNTTIMAPLDQWS